MSFYLSILAVQNPFPIGEDDNGRAMYSCNFELTARYPVSDSLREVVRVLTDAGAATLYDYSTGVGDTFLGPVAVIPPELGNVGPFIHVLDNVGGSSPDETHTGGRVLHMTCQLIVRSSDPDLARARATAAWSALDGVRNTEIVA